MSGKMEDNATVAAGVFALAAMSDAQLVEQTMAGKREAFDELIRRHQRKAVAVSYRLLGNSHDAAEVAQDAFMKAYSSVKTLESPEKFGGWLMRIVSNLSLNRRRGRRQVSTLPGDELLGSGEGMSGDAAGKGVQTGRADDPYQQLEGKELGKQLWDALDKLTDKQRIAMVMFTIEGMPQKEIAEAMQCGIEAVKWHVFQGRKRLRELLKDVLTEQ